MRSRPYVLFALALLLPFRTGAGRDGAGPCVDCPPGSRLGAFARPQLWTEPGGQQDLDAGPALLRPRPVSDPQVTLGEPTAPIPASLAPAPPGSGILTEADEPDGPADAAAVLLPPATESGDGQVVVGSVTEVAQAAATPRSTASPLTKQCGSSSVRQGQAAQKQGSAETTTPPDPLPDWARRIPGFSRGVAPPQLTTCVLAESLGIAGPSLQR